MNVSQIFDAQLLEDESDGRALAYLHLGVINVGA